MHGGASPGAPLGNKNSLKHGAFSADAIEATRHARCPPPPCVAAGLVAIAKGRGSGRRHPPNLYRLAFLGTLEGPATWKGLAEPKPYGV